MEQKNEAEREAQLEQLIENKDLTAVLMSFLDLRIIHDLTNLVLEPRFVSRYKIKKDDLIWGVLPEELRRLHQLMDQKKMEAANKLAIMVDDDLDGVYRSQNELSLLPLLFENLVHGAMEIPWGQRFVIADDWKVVINGAYIK